MDTINGFAPIESANDSAGLMTVAWYEDLQGGWGESIGAAA